MGVLMEGTYTTIWDIAGVCKNVAARPFVSRENAQDDHSFDACEVVVLGLPQPYSSNSVRLVLCSQATYTSHCVVCILDAVTVG